MALSDKNIVITPNRGQSADPKVDFIGASSTLGPQTISLNVYPTTNGTLSFEGSAGQLFSITNSMTGTIYSVNDVSGIPSIEVLDTGLVKLAQYSGNVVVGSGTDTAEAKLQVTGGGFFTGQIGNSKTTRGVYLGLSASNDPQIQLQGNGAANPHIDFSNDTNDFDMRIILAGDDTLNITGGSLTVEGNIVLHAGNYTQYASGGGIPDGSMLISYFTTPPSADYILLDGNYYSVASYPVLVSLGFPTRPGFGGTVGGVTGNPDNVVVVDVVSEQYSLSPGVTGSNLVDGAGSWEDWPAAGWHTQYVDLYAEIFAYATFTFPIPTIIHTYAILPRSGNGGNTDRWWIYKWKWYASNDNQNWTLLEHQDNYGVGQAYMSQGSTNIENAGGFYLNNWSFPSDTIFNNLDRTFNGSQTAYKYYKFVPLEGEWGQFSYIVVNEIRLKGVSYPADTSVRKVPLAPQGNQGFYYYLKV